MKNFLLCITLLLFLFGCKVQPSILTRVHTKLSPVPTSIDKSIEDGFGLKVEPVSSSELNKESYYSALRGSNVGVWQTFYKKNQPSKDKFIQYLNILLSEDKVSEAMYDSFLAEYLQRNFTFGNFLNKDSLSPSKFPGKYNPYLGRNFSVFRLIFTNETSSVKKISLSNIFVNSNYEQLSPIGIKYFDTIYGPDSPLYGNILRMNMPNELRIPPLQKVMKYIAVPAINPENKNYSITIITGSDALSYDFIQEKEQITNDFIVYQIVPVVNKSNITDVFVLVENKGYLMQLHQDRKVLINESRQDDVVNVYFIIFKKNAFKFGSRTNIKFSSFKYDYQVEVHQTHSKVIKD